MEHVNGTEGMKSQPASKKGQDGGGKDMGQKTKGSREMGREDSGLAFRSSKKYVNER